MWNEEKLNSYIENQIEENINLDYKASGSLQNSEGKKTEISKDVSAFANSNGGIIIYGITERNEGAKYLPEKIDPINRANFSKETLEQIINSRISPTIHGVIIHPVNIGDPEDKNVVYIVEIPQSNTAHQAFDKRYYRRYNFQSVMMDDWEIKDIINRQQNTIAEITFRPIFPLSHENVLMREDFTKPIVMEYDIIATNMGRKVIKYLDFLVAGPPEAVDYIHKSKVVDNKVELYFTNEQNNSVIIENNETIVNIQRMPILARTFRTIGSISFYSDFLKSDNKIILTTITDDNHNRSKISGKDIYKNLMRKK